MANLPTLRQFQLAFPTEDACLAHMMLTRYGRKHVCGGCAKEAKFHRVKLRRSYACEHCGYQVYPTAGTPLHNTRTSLRDWFYVMFLFTTTRNGVAAKRVEREIGVTYKTAWRMCRLVRDYMGYVDGGDPIGGFDGKPVEIDHAFIGGADRLGESDKKVVLGMVEKGGNVIAKHMPDRKSENVLPEIMRNVKPGSRITSDAEHSFGALGYLGKGYDHVALNHRQGEYSRRGRSTGSVEGFWSLVKRGISGTYIHVSQKHLQTYLHEFEFRYNLRNQPELMLALLLQSFPRPASLAA